MTKEMNTVVLYSEKKCGFLWFNKIMRQTPTPTIPEVKDFLVLYDGTVPNPLPPNAGSPVPGRYSSAKWLAGQASSTRQKDVLESASFWNRLFMFVYKIGTCSRRR